MCPLENNTLSISDIIQDKCFEKSILKEFSKRKSKVKGKLVDDSDEETPIVNDRERISMLNGEVCLF